MRTYLLLSLSLIPNACFSESAPNMGSIGLFDKNGDGVRDVFYEYFEDGSYLESFDSNYDGKVDQKCKYNSNDTLEVCNYDQDFNGDMETRTEFVLGSPVREGVDLDGNASYEIIFFFKMGVISEAYRYRKSKGGDSKIEMVKFSFGFPSEPKSSKTSMSPLEFSKHYWEKADKLDSNQHQLD